MKYAEFMKEYEGLGYDIFLFALYKIAIKNIDEEEFKKVIEEVKQEKQEYEDGLKVACALTKTKEIVNKQKPTPPPPKVVWR
jgi:hypothetical protein